MFALIPEIQVSSDAAVKGKITCYEFAVKDHIKAIIELPEINVEKAKTRKFKVVLDTINGMRCFCLNLPSLQFFRIDFISTIIIHFFRSWGSYYERVARNFWL